MRVDWAELASRKRFRWLAAVVAALLLALVLGRDFISHHLVPDPRMNDRLLQAQSALAKGRLSAADGSGARELFESVLAADPDQMMARQGLTRVRDAAINRARKSMDQRRLSSARSSLALAAELSAPQVQLQPLQARLRDLERGSGEVAGLLARANAAGASEKDALALYDRALQLDADNPAIEQARSELLSRRLARADALLGSGRVQDAQQIIAQVIDADPGNLDLPPVQARLGEAVVAQQRRRQAALSAALREESAGRLELAASHFQQLSAEPDATAAQAREALRRIATHMAERATHEAADFQFRRAESSLAKARRWSPGAAAVALAAQRIAQSRQVQQRMTRPRGGSTQSLQQVLDEARQAIERGDFITPPGTSAWDRLRVARAMSPSSPDLPRLEAQLQSRSRECFESALTGNQLRRAQVCLESCLTVNPGMAFNSQARRRLEDRWLAFAEERLAASDYEEAGRALAAAARWQPGDARIKSAQARLRRARGTQK